VARQLADGAAAVPEEGAGKDVLALAAHDDTLGVGRPADVLGGCGGGGGKEGWLSLPSLWKRQELRHKRKK
jgi:hypothetical protein